MTEVEMVGWHHQLNGYEFEQALGVGDGQGGLLTLVTPGKSLKLMFIESVMPSNHLILCCPLLLQPSILPSIRVFSNESFFTSGGQSIGVSTSTSVLPMNIPD